MIPQRLEEIILRGGGKYKNHTHGLGGAGTIKVPGNNWIVIFAFKYYHFIDPNPGGEVFVNRNNTLITFTSESNRYQYVARDSYIRTLASVAAPIEIFRNIIGESDFCTYQVHSKDVALDILKFRAPGDMGAQVIGVLPDGVPDEPVVELGGYGTGAGGVPVLNSVALDGAGATEVYIPLGQRGALVFPPPPTDPKQRFEFSTDAAVGTAINPPIGGMENGTQYPLLDISYVEINEEPPANLVK